MKSFDEVFDKVLELIHQKVVNGELTSVAYDMWIHSMKPVKLEDNVAYFTVQSKFQQGIIMKNYEKMIKEAFLNVMGFDVEINISPAELSDENDSKPIKDREELEITFSNAEYDYTFDTFIVGKSNEFAHAACVAVSKNQGGVYNPLFIHGPSGLGKTHLLTAVSNAIKTNKPDTNIIYVTGEAFTNELINAIREQTTHAFRKKYRNADVLLMDDIQFISGKESTQEEFFHTFNELHSQGKQIILTSDRPPKDIKTLEERIRTRFEWGLIADITPPDFETRVAIIKRKADLLNLTLTDDVVETIATRLKADIRQLEGCVKKLKASQHLMGTPPTMTQAMNAIREILSDDTIAPVTVDRIIAEVAGIYGVTSDDIRSMKRSSQISTARKVAAYVIKEMTQLSLQNIGAELGGKNHSTVSFYIDSISEAVANDSGTKETIEDIIKNIKGATS
ncbi:MAG: chromosomal replication initiator protein DnaA [Oscillospiraceae bacterium]|nr:chromosomal replication initiator protein DnaA [Oscillospiraceae bacterium]MDY6207346.1 chromosomal replication initiator protein DnaA [Oscillospiraceae bacterium]